MTMHYSVSRNQLVSADLRAEYEAAGTWPDDAAPIADDAYDALYAQLSTGKRLAADASGNPVALDAPAPDPKLAVQAEIDQLERDSMTNRGARELQLELMREKGATNGLQTDEAIAAKVPYFKKLLALDVQIRTLRAQL